jgi:hypothetical protein
MSTTFKLWTSLGVAAAVASISLPAVAADASKHKNHGQMVETAAAGEAGESGDAELKTNDSDFIAQLGFILGHMRVGTALYSQGEAAMAQTHMKHPRDEIYTQLEPVLKTRKSLGFAAELDAVSSAVAAGAVSSEVDAKFAILTSQIGKNLPENLSAQMVGAAVVIMVRTAAEEYAIGVKDGKIDNIHEYQDAFGFIETAKLFVANLSTAERDEHKKDVESIEAELQALASHWPDIIGKAPVSTDAKAIFAAAAKIELLALAL